MRSTIQIVLVTFRDPTVFYEWSTMDAVDASKPKECVAYGRLLEENNDVVKVGLLSSKDGVSASNWIVIPASCVTSTEVVKEIDDR